MDPVSRTPAPGGVDNPAPGGESTARPAPSSQLLQQNRGQVLYLTLNRPDKRNALTAGLCRELTAAITAASTRAQQDCSVRAIVLSGAGPVFCAGADLNGGAYDGDFHGDLHRALRAIINCAVPVIADVQGPAVGAGTQLAVACDLRVVGDEAWFKVPVTSLGFALDNWTIRRCVSLLGGARARNMLLAGQRLSAAQAIGSGFATDMGDSSRASQLAEQLAQAAPLSVRQLKGVLNDEGFGFELRPHQQELYDRCWASEDAQEAREAREAGRPPQFRGR